MQREFRTVEALLNDKDSKIIALEESIQSKVIKQTNTTKVANTQTEDVTTKYEITEH